LTTMRWLTLFTWILLVAMALPAARVPLVSLAGQAACALGGFAAIIVFAAGGASAFAWSAFGIACAGTLFAAAAAHTLIEDAPATMLGVEQGRKETVAGVEGLELVLFPVTILLSAAVALA
jgi:hypothetical protein